MATRQLPGSDSGKKPKVISIAPPPCNTDTSLTPSSVPQENAEELPIPGPGNFPFYSPSDQEEKLRKLEAGIIAGYNQMICNLLNSINTREPGKRFPTAAEVDTLYKLTKFKSNIDHTPAPRKPKPAELRRWDNFVKSVMNES